LWIQSRIGALFTCGVELICRGGLGSQPPTDDETSCGDQ